MHSHKDGACRWDYNSCWHAVTSCTSSRADSCTSSRADSCTNSRTKSCSNSRAESCTSSRCRPDRVYQVHTLCITVSSLHGPNNPKTNCFSDSVAVHSFPSLPYPDRAIHPCPILIEPYIPALPSSSHTSMPYPHRVIQPCPHRAIHPCPALIEPYIPALPSSGHTSLPCLHRAIHPCPALIELYIPALRSSSYTSLPCAHRAIHPWHALIELYIPAMRSSSYTSLTESSWNARIPSCYMLLITDADDDQKKQQKMVGFLQGIYLAFPICFAEDIRVLELSQLHNAQLCNKSEQ